MGQSLRMTVYACALAALMVVGSYLQIPIGPVPIVLANLFVLLAGLLLGSRWGAASVALYLFLGLIGLPVYAGGAAGPAALFGPTGGYLFGYLAAAFLTGLISERRQGGSPRPATAGSASAAADRSGMGSTHGGVDGRMGAWSRASARDVIALVVGALSIYLLGLPWLKLSLGITWQKALLVGMLPFLVGDGLKVAAAFAVVRILQSTAAELFPTLSNRAAR